jgi:hypothetical protein
MVCWHDARVGFHFVAEVYVVCVRVFVCVLWVYVGCPLRDG